MRVPKIYCAGRIAHGDWRTGLYDNNTPSFRDWESEAYERQVETFPVTQMIGHEALYTGPYFVACDHGCYHGEASHGVGADEGGGCAGGPGTDLRRKATVRACGTAIRNSDMMYVYLEDLEAYGTLVEIGMAVAADIPVYINIKTGVNIDRAMWFALTAAERVGYGNTPASSLSESITHFNRWGRTRGRNQW